MKRGVTTFPFLIIFVVIDGAIILIFFFGFGTDILNISDKYNDLSTLKNIDQQLAAFALPENGFNNNINLGRKAPFFSSCKNGNSLLSLNNQFLTTYKLILAPISLEELSLKAWTLSWDFPFKVENLYFISNSNIEYFFDNNPSITAEEKKFADDFHLLLNKRKLSDLTSSPTSTKKIIVLFNLNPTSHQ